MVFDYGNKVLIIKKNSKFKSKFQYNKSGLELAHDGFHLVRTLENLVPIGQPVNGDQGGGFKSNQVIVNPWYKVTLRPIYKVVELRKGSAAEKAGLEKGDILIKINGKETHRFSLQELMAKFFDDVGTVIRLKVMRRGREINVKFKLEDVFETKKP